MTERERIALRRANETQPEGRDSYGFRLGQFARELEQLKRDNAEMYARARGERAKRTARR